ncbi:MAG: hypothetical protein QOE77_2057 [Blastocatellia bacterium]|nr:hypothetical protein [Blastocatellia bacterium]
MKRWLFTISFLLCLMSRGSVPVAGTNSRPLQKVPRYGVVTVRLMKAPGLNLPGSKWEIAYELRMLPESRLFQERAKLNDNSSERAGDLIKKATLAKPLASASGQTLTLEIPFDALTLEKLKHQPADRLAPGQDAKSQIFVFYSVINVHDAKLKKTLTIPVARIWDFANFPGARFEINIEIGNDETFNVKSSSLKSRDITTQRRTP